MPTQNSQDISEQLREHADAVWNDYEGLDAFKKWVASGTHEGEMAELDILPTNNSVTWKGVTVYKLDGDEVTEAWWYYDMAGILIQVGAIPEVPSA